MDSEEHLSEAVATRHISTVRIEREEGGEGGERKRMECERERATSRGAKDLRREGGITSRAIIIDP
jgi:hypothetical protein